MDTQRPPLPPVAVAPMRPKRRRWMRALVFNVVAVVVVVLAAPHAVAIPAVRESIEQAIGEELGAKCRIERMGFSWFRGFAAEGLELQNPPGFPSDHPLLRARRVDMDLALVSLCRGRGDVRATLTGLELAIDRLADGTDNLAALGAGTGRTSDPGPAPSANDGARPPGTADGSDREATSPVGSSTHGNRHADPDPAHPSLRPEGLANLRLDLLLREGTIVVRREGQLQQTLSDITATVQKSFGSQQLAVELATAVHPAEGAPGRIVARFAGDLVTRDGDGLLTLAGVDLHGLQPLLPGITALAGRADGTLTLRAQGLRTFSLDGALTVVGAHAAGPWLQGLDLAAPRWTLQPIVTVAWPTDGSPPQLQAERFRLDLGSLLVTGLDAATTQTLLPGPALGFAITLDVAALATANGPLPPSWRDSGARLVGTAAVPFGPNDLDLTALPTRLAAALQLTADRLDTPAGALSPVHAELQLRDGTLRLRCAAPTQWNGGALALGATLQFADPTAPTAPRPSSPDATLQATWRDGLLDRGATELLRYAFPVLAGDAGLLQCTGRGSCELALQGPAWPAAGASWLQWLDEWTGQGSVELREGTVVPLPALRPLLQPFPALPGVGAEFGEAGRLAFDACTVPWTLQRGAVTAAAGRWLRKGRTIGLSGTVRLDGALDYGFDVSALLQGHRDGERVLRALGGSAPAVRLAGTIEAPIAAVPDLGGVARAALEQQVHTNGAELLHRALDELLRARR